MGDVKWIKVYTNMISNKKIKRIRTMPEGNNIVLIWVFLLAQAGESNKNGALYLTDTMPFSVEDLAIEFEFEPSVIRLALITLEKFSMIEVFDEVIYIKNWAEYQNIDGLEKIREQTRKRVNDFRERKKTVLLNPAIGEYVCAYCGRKAGTIDHIIPRSKNGPDVPSNCVHACKSCNSSKKDKDLADFLNDSFALTYQEVDHDLVRSNQKLMSFVTYDQSKKRYSNATVTQSNATDIDIELDKEKEILILTNDESSFLESIRSVNGYPYDREKDLEMYKTLESRYPTLDVVESVKDWCINKLDKPLKAGQNPRGQINTWMKKSVEYGKNIKSNKPREVKTFNWNEMTEEERKEWIS